MATSNSLDRYSAGDIDAAVETALAEVRAAPMSVDVRLRLCELLVVQGSLERADKQLDLIATQDPSTAPGVSLFRQLLRAAEMRQQFHAQGRVPDVVAEPDATLRYTLEAAALLRSGDPVAAAAKAEVAEQSRKPLSGTCNGQRFSDFRDADDLAASYFEVLAPNGKFYIIPHSLVASLEFQPPRTIRDLVFRPAEIRVIGGFNGFVYLPAIYPGRPDDPPLLRMGRASEWTDAAPVRGRGQRVFLVGDNAMPISEMKTLEFDSEASHAS